MYTDDISNKQFLDLGRLLPQNRGSGARHWAPLLIENTLFMSTALHSPSATPPSLPARNHSAPVAVPGARVNDC